MTPDWKWEIADTRPRAAKPETDAWALVDGVGEELARVYEAQKPDDDGLTFCWAIRPYYVVGNVGSSRTSADARFYCEKRLAAGNEA